MANFTIGIPKALIYWKGWGGKFWKEYFENLGLNVIVSPSSNKKIVNKGVKLADQEACFALKTFFGHIWWLDKNADKIFIPRLKENEKGLEFCPKFFALPDLVTLLSDKEVIAPEINYNKEKVEEIGLRLGKELGKKPKEIKEAVKSAKQKVKEQKEEKLKKFKEKLESDEEKIVLVSHPYNLYDDYVNLGIREKIEELGAQLIPIDEVPESEKKREEDFPDWHWEFGEEITNQINEVLKYDLAGAIEISSFQCGCDAVLKEFVEKKFKDSNIPFLYLLIDEQTAEAGLQTRLEAFVDTLRN